MRSYLKYLPISRSSGSRLARMLPWEMTTPRGSAVVPEVKTISTMSSRVRGGGVTGCGHELRSTSSRSVPDRSMRSAGMSGSRGLPTHSFASTCSATRCAKVRRSDLVDGHDDRAPQQTSEESGHPLGAVLAPEQYLVAIGRYRGFQLARKAVCTRQHLAIGPALHAVSPPVDVGHLALRAGGSCPGTPGWWCAVH